MMYNPNMLPKVRSKSLRDACKHMPCTLRIASFVPGHRCASEETVVGCHLPVEGKGVNTKVSDLFLAAGCAHCHDLLDYRDNRMEWIVEKFPAALGDRILRGLVETQSRWVGMDLIHVPNAKVIQL